MLTGALFNPIRAQSSSTSFLANAGQMMNANGTANPNLLFSGQVGNAKLYITKTNMSLVYFQTAPDSTKKDSIYRMDIVFKTPNAAVTVTGQNMSTSYNNYFIGTLERRDVKEYGKIMLTNLWPNISLELVSTETELKFNYLLAVGANPNNIQLIFNNAKTLTYINQNLTFTAPFNNTSTLSKFNWTAPSGQSLTPAPSVSGSFNASTRTFGVIATNYQSSSASSIAQNIALSAPPTGPIAIPPPYPILKWGTYYGGTARDVVKDIYLSPSNIMYVLGETQSFDFPVLKPLPEPFLGFSDLWIAKFKANRVREFSTYLGSPDGFEEAGGIAVNSVGEIYVSGSTSSIDYPLQPGSFTFNGTDKLNPSQVQLDRDGVITKLAPDGKYKRWSSYFATSAYDRLSDLAIDQQDNVYMVGNMVTGAADLPLKTLAGGFNQTYNTCNLNFGEAYIAKFNKFDTLVWSTYYGNCSNDQLRTCTIDKQNNLLVYGVSSSQGTVGVCNNTSPMQVCGIAGSYQQQRSLDVDSYIAKFNPQGQITWSTFYGGISSDACGSTSSCLITDTLGDIYITGVTGGSFPLTASGTNQTVFGGNSDAFVVRFSNTGVRKWASYLGGNSEDRPTSISLLKNGDFLIAGKTQSTNFPYQSSQGFFNDNSYNGLVDGFLTQYSSSNVRKSSSYIGGTKKDNDPISSSQGFNFVMSLNTVDNPLYLRPYGSAYFDASFNGVEDAFLMSMNLDPDPCNVFPMGCRTSGLDEAKTNNLFSVYPNPTNDNITISLGTDLASNKTLMVYDLYGKLILQQLILAQQESLLVDLSNNRKGIYLIKIVSENSNFTEKVILN